MKVLVFYPGFIRRANGECFTSSIQLKSILLWSEYLDTLKVVTYESGDELVEHRIDISEFADCLLPVKARKGWRGIADFVRHARRLLETSRANFDYIVLFDPYLENQLVHRHARRAGWPQVYRMTGRYDLWVYYSLKDRGMLMQILGKIYSCYLRWYQSKVMKQGLVVTDGDMDFVPATCRDKIGFVVESQLTGDRPMENPYLHRVSDGVFRILSLSRIHPAKGIDCLIRAVAKLRNEGASQLLLDIVGEPAAAYHDYYDHLKKLADELGVADMVVFHGWVTFEERERFLSSASVLVVPSSDDADGVPKTVIEAMAVGIPVVASRVGGMKYLFAGTDSGGILVPRNDPTAIAVTCAELMADNNRANQLSNSGYRHAVSLTQDVVIPELLRQFSHRSRL